MKDSVKCDTATEVTVEHSKKWSVVSIVGFGLSLLAFSIYLGLTLNIFIGEDFTAMLGVLYSFVFALPIVFVGITISVIGAVIAIKRTQRGKGFALAGIVLCAPCLVWGLLWMYRAFFRVY